LRYIFQSARYIAILRSEHLSVFSRNYSFVYLYPNLTNLLKKTHLGEKCSPDRFLLEDILIYLGMGWGRVKGASCSLIAIVGDNSIYYFNSFVCMYSIFQVQVSKTMGSFNLTVFSMQANTFKRPP
jgi:hypothetical protein